MAIESLSDSITRPSEYSSTGGSKMAFRLAGVIGRADGGKRDALSLMTFRSRSIAAGAGPRYPRPASLRQAADFGNSDSAASKTASGPPNRSKRALAALGDNSSRLSLSQALSSRSFNIGIPTVATQEVSRSPIRAADGPYWRQRRRTPYTVVGAGRNTSGP